MQGSQERVADCTTSNFDGLICMLHPEESWVAKWQRIGAHLSHHVWPQRNAWSDCTPSRWSVACRRGTS